jgi:hypothetical protein
MAFVEKTKAKFIAPIQQKKTYLITFTVLPSSSSVKMY